MTLSELNQHFNLLRKLAAAEEMLQSLQSKILTGPKLDGMPHGSGYSDRTGNFAADMADLEARIAYYKQQVKESAVTVDAFTNAVESERTRILLRLRFLYGLAWCEVSYYAGNLHRGSGKAVML